MVVGMPYTVGITGRLDFGPCAESSRDDLRLVDFLGLFFAGIATLKRWLLSSVKSESKAEFSSSALTQLKPSELEVRPERSYVVRTCNRLLLDAGKHRPTVEEREPPIE